MDIILVPTDFSDAADNAALYAARYAQSINARMILFHVYHVPVSAAPAFPVMPVTFDELQAENEAWLQKKAKELHRKTGADIRCRVKIGLAGDEILEVQNVDLIIMGTKGAGRIDQVLPGSIATSVFRKSKIPVLLVPEKAEYKKIRTLMFACDYDPARGFSLPLALQGFAKPFEPAIFVVNVKHKKESVVINAQVAMKPGGQMDNVEHLYYFSEQEDLADGISEFAVDHNADIIAVIPHQYGLLEGIFHKSISKQLAFHSHIPLLASPDDRRYNNSF